MSGKTRPDQEITLPIIGPTSISYLQRCFEMVGRIGLAATFMLVLLLPADSVSVEDGKAIPVQATALLASALAILAGGWNSRSDPLLCALGGAIALWLFITSGMLSGVGNVRSAMHESWVWIAMGLLVFGSRAVFWRGSDRRLLVGWCLIMVWCCR